MLILILEATEPLARDAEHTPDVFKYNNTVTPFALSKLGTRLREASCCTSDDGYVI